jgi:hypothetical protein
MENTGAAVGVNRLTAEEIAAAMAAEEEAEETERCRISAIWLF